MRIRFPHDDCERSPEMAGDALLSMARYQGVLDSIFGRDECSVRLKQSHVNNFVGAVVFAGNSPYFKFAAAFKQRLRRLHAIYESNSLNRSAVLRLATDVASASPEGPYGELACLDFMNRGYRHYFGDPVDIEINLPISETFRSLHKPRRICNLDGKIDCFNLHYEVKSLIDVTNGILENIVRQLRLKHQAIIVPERDTTFNYAHLQQRVKTLTQELDNVLTKKQTFLQSTTVPGLRFRIGWPPAVVRSSASVNPFQMAEHRHWLFFDYAYKFLHSKPFLLVITVPPWSNPYHLRLANMNETFFRSVCRRIFCGYMHSQLVQPEYNETYWKISKAISGILFLELNDDLGDKPEPQIEPYLYLNPNANCAIDGRFIDFIVSSQRGFLDDFRYDNY